jgi:hypothetical protein
MAPRSAVGSTASASGGLPTSLDVPLQLIASDTFYSDYVRTLNFALRFQEVRRAPQRRGSDVTNQPSRVSRLLTPRVPGLSGLLCGIIWLALTRKPRVQQVPVIRPASPIQTDPPRGRRKWLSGSSRSPRELHCACGGQARRCQRKHRSASCPSRMAMARRGRPPSCQRTPTDRSFRSSIVVQYLALFIFIVLRVSARDFRLTGQLKRTYDSGLYCDAEPPCRS